jgi:hypothetical protein
MKVQTFLSIIIVYILDLPVYKAFSYLYNEHIKNLRMEWLKFLLIPYKYIRYDKDLFYKDRREFVCNTEGLWRLSDYLHLLNVKDQVIYIDLLTFCIDFFKVCDLNRSFRSFIQPNKLITESEIKHFFRHYTLFQPIYFEMFSVDRKFTISEMLQVRLKKVNFYKKKPPKRKKRKKPVKRDID